jgi:hypothetical protein
MSSSFTVDHLLAQDLNSSGDLLLNNASTGTVVVGSRLQVGLNESAYTLPSSRGSTDQVLTASGDQVVWANAQGGGGGGTLIQNPQGTSIVTCAVPSAITGTVDSIDRLVCDAEKFMISSPDTGTRIELGNPPPPPPDEMSVAAPGPTTSTGINMYVQDFRVFSADEIETKLYSERAVYLSTPTSGYNLGVTLSGVVANDYYLPPTNGTDGYVMTARSNSRAEWLPPVSKPSFAVTFGGQMQQDGYFVLNGISSTPTSTSISVSNTFVIPINCILKYVSYNTNFTGTIPSTTKVIISTPVPSPFIAEVAIGAEFGYSEELFLILPQGTKICLRFSCPTVAMNGYEASFTCLFQQ